MRLLLALLVAAAAVPAAAAAPAAPAVRTLATADAPITAFAQDGSHLAWATFDGSGGPCRVLVRVRDLRRRFQDAVTRSGDPSCRAVLPATGLAVAGDRALWDVSSSGNNEYHELYTASLSRPGARTVTTLTWPTGDDGRIALVGAGSLLGYAWSVAGTATSGDCADRGTCPFLVQTGGLVRVGADVDASPAGAPAAAAAAAGGRVAILVRGVPGARTNPRAELWEVEVDDDDGIVGSFVAPAPVLELAASPTTIAAHTAIARVELYAPGGRKLRTVRVPRSARDVALAGDRVVYRVGRSIFVAGRTAPLGVAASAPVGLSVSGRRVAWAENVDGRGRIRALELARFDAAVPGAYPDM